MNVLKDWVKESREIADLVCGELKIENEGLVLQVILDKAIRPFHYYKQENDGGKKEIKSDLPDVSDIELKPFVKRLIDDKALSKDQYMDLKDLCKKYNRNVKWTNDMIVTLPDIPLDVLRKNLINMELVR